MLDFPGSPEVAHEHGVPLIVDSTLATPYLCRPLDTAPTSWSTRPPSSSAATAPPSAGSSSTAGASTSSAAGGFPGFTEPDPSYHGLVFWRSSPSRCSRPATSPKARLQYLRDIGPAIAPFNSFLFFRGSKP